MMEDDLGNWSLICSDKCGPEVHSFFSQLNEKETSFELIEALLMYIRTLNVLGGLASLPGWNLMIYTMQKRLEMTPGFEYIVEFFDRGYAILSIAVAETSITINDVLYLIDCCKQKVKLFTAHNNINCVTVWAKTNLEWKGIAGYVLQTRMTPERFTPFCEIAWSIKLLQLGGIHFLAKAIKPPPLGAVMEAECTLRGTTICPQGSVLTKIVMGGEEAGKRFCEQKRLSMAMLRMTWKAIVQLKGTIFCSLSTECLMTQPFNSTGPHNNLDVVISLLAFVYPNVCCHKEKRKILNTEGHNAFHKLSVSCPFSTQNIKYLPPFVCVFGEKQGFLPIKLKMPHSVAACIPAVHAAMEALTVEVTKDLGIIQLDPPNEQMRSISSPGHQAQASA
ncbi:LOW QUALITY PROTEIN: ATP-dependent RNA helicase A [Mergus octosetaceus]